MSRTCYSNNITFTISHVVSQTLPEPVGLRDTGGTNDSYTHSRDMVRPCVSLRQLQKSELPQHI